MCSPETSSEASNTIRHGGTGGDNECPIRVATTYAPRNAAEGLIPSSSVMRAGELIGTVVGGGDRSGEEGFPAAPQDDRFWAGGGQVGEASDPYMGEAADLASSAIAPAAPAVRIYPAPN